MANEFLVYDRMTVSQNELARLNLSVSDARLWLESHCDLAKVGFLQSLPVRVRFFGFWHSPCSFLFYEWAVEGQPAYREFATHGRPSSRRDYRGLLQVLLIRRYGHRGIAAAFDKKTSPLTGGVFAFPSLVLVFAGEPDYLA